MAKYTYIFLIIMFFAACANPREIQEKKIEIKVNEKIDTFIDINSFTHSIDSLTLRAGSGYYISDIKDVCYTDSTVYLLDAASTIYSFSTQSGAMTGMMKKIGHSRKEYITANAIECDGRYLYILDFQSRRIIKYDKNMDYVSDVVISLPVFDFAKVDDGYLLYNMNVTDTDKQIVHIDEEASVIDTFLEADKHNGILLSDKFFCGYGNNGETYVMQPNARIIYVWNGEGMQTECSIDFGNGMSASDDVREAMKNGKPILMRSFVTDTKIISLFLANKMVYTNIYDRSSKSTVTGIIKTNTLRPFVPQTSYKNSLVGVYSNMMLNKEDNSLTLIKYNMK